MRELIKSYEAWHPETDTFDHTVIIWKDGENYYQISHSARDGTFDLNDLPTPSPIPMEPFKAHWNPSLTECPQPSPMDSYRKSPAIMLLEDINPSTRTPGEDMLREAEMYEIIKQYPHPNICHYYGCIRNGQDLTAICLRKYKCSLRDAVRGGAPVDRDVIVSGIAKGLQFLHDTIGLVHNDINPSNIMLDDQGHPVIIDFDSCAPIGQDMDGRKTGTFGWVRKPEPRICTVESDDYALSLIGQYLDGKVDDGDLPLPLDVSIECHLFMMTISFIFHRTETV